MIDKLTVRSSGWVLCLCWVLAMPTEVMAQAITDAATARAEARRQAAESILKDIRQATAVPQGKSPRVIYAFVDPNCPYCHKLFKDIQPAIERGQVSVHWIPVGVLMNTSAGKAAAILESKDRLAALKKNEDEFSRDNGFGGIYEEPLPSDQTLKQLATNLALLRRSGDEAVPTMVFRINDGTAIMLPGAPPPKVLEQIIEQLK